MGSVGFSPCRRRQSLATPFSALFVTFVGMDIPTFDFSVTGFATVLLTVVFLLHSLSVFFISLLCCFPNFFGHFGLYLHDFMPYLLSIYGRPGDNVVLSCLSDTYGWIISSTSHFITFFALLAGATAVSSIDFTPLAAADSRHLLVFYSLLRRHHEG
jgi:hypothetical protein